MTADRSHNGESSIVAKLLGDLAVPFVVDVGASDGLSWSNSAMFIDHGWQALLIEPVQFAFDRLSAAHGANPRAILVKAACSDHDGEGVIHVASDMLKMASSLTPFSQFDSITFEGQETVPLFRLSTLLARHNVPAAFGLLTVDAEQHDLEVLQGLDFAKHRPMTIIVEENTSSAQIRALLVSLGYEHFELVAGENNVYFDATNAALFARARKLAA